MSSKGVSNFDSFPIKILELLERKPYAHSVMNSSVTTDTHREGGVQVQHEVDLALIWSQKGKSHA